ncbi:uncharacterized protein LOC131737361 [Acipenser ruthenus]|uniref:uncharacterized protein LOC131737361 n=1 Tax=Acipenser ruthenus TaxID=7906 RepID=UPI0027427FFB|nr:uncharacterized protein LOC131737361 [Acipenser ruthenus]
MFILQTYNKANVLVKVQYRSNRKYIKLPEACFNELITEGILDGKPVGASILKEYEENGSLTDSSRRQVVNILAAHMTKIEGRMPRRQTKEKYALGIITLFPSLKDPLSKKGYVSLYCSEGQQFHVMNKNTFAMLFGPDTAARLLEKWSTCFKERVIKEAGTLTLTSFLQRLIVSAENKVSGLDNSPGIKLGFKGIKVCFFVVLELGTFFLLSIFTHLMLLLFISWQMPLSWATYNCYKLSHYFYIQLPIYTVGFLLEQSR